MSTKIVNLKSALSTMGVFLSAAVLISVLAGCASTAPTTGPGTPDAVQSQHYEMLKAAIEAKSKNDALAALALLDADVSRWQVSWTVIASTMHDQTSLTDAVNEEDWTLANERFLSLKAKYGHP
jgi:hypothetical protein